MLSSFVNEISSSFTVRLSSVEDDWRQPFVVEGCLPERLPSGSCFKIREHAENRVRWEMERGNHLIECVCKDNENPRE